MHPRTEYTLVTHFSQHWIQLEYWKLSPIQASIKFRSLAIGFLVGWCKGIHTNFTRLSWYLLDLEFICHYSYNIVNFGHLYTCTSSADLACRNMLQIFLVHHCLCICICGWNCHYLYTYWYRLIAGNVSSCIAYFILHIYAY